MRFLAYTTLAFFVIAGITVTRAEMRVGQHVSLIAEIQKKYRSLGVSLLLPHKNRGSREFTLAYVLTRELSRKFVASIIKRYDEAPKLLKTYERRGTRPLMVVVLKSVKDIKNFSKNIRNLKVSYPHWLLIFTDAFGEPVCGYCNRPKGNMFGLRFDTEMLVSCCGDPMINEWWAVGQNQTKVAAFGRWNTKGYFELMTEKSLYARRNKLDGAKLMVAFRTSSPYYFVKNGQKDGLFVAIFEELKRVMNVTTTVILSEAGGNNIQDHSEYMAGNGVDLFVGDFHISADGRDHVDFTRPLIATTRVLIVKKPDDTNVPWFALFRVLSYPVWMAMLLALITTVVLVTLMQIKRTASGHGFFTNFINVWSVFCGKGLPEFPPETPLRIIYCSIYILNVTVWAAYSGTLISLSVLEPVLPFSSIEEFALAGSHRLILPPNSMMWKVWKNPDNIAAITLKTLLSSSQPENFKEAIEQVREYLSTIVCTQKVGFFMSGPKLTPEEMYIMSHSPCEFVRINGRFAESYGMILPKGNQYTGVVKYHIQRFIEGGLIKRLEWSYADRPPESTDDSKRVNIGHVALILTILAAGITGSLIILLGERLYKMLSIPAKERKRQKRRKIIVRKILKDLRKHHVSRLQSRLRRRRLNLDNWQLQYLP